MDGFAEGGPQSAAVEQETVTYQRRKGKQRDAGCVTDQGLRFDGSVPVETIQLSLPQDFAEGFERVSERVTPPGPFVDSAQHLWS